VATSITGVSSVSFWVKPTSITTVGFMDFDGGTHKISVSSGTISATGFTLPTIYVNGVVSSTLVANSWQYVTVTTGTAITANAIRFGRISSTSLTGKLDSISIFNYARTAAQVAWDYNRGAPVGWWKMDECQGTTANDSSGNGNTGTITVGGSGTQTAVGTCTASATTMWYTGRTGKYNSSLNFDGTDDYVDMGNVSSLNFDKTSSFTLSTWIKTNSTTGFPTFLGKLQNSPRTGYGIYLVNSGVGTVGGVGFTITNSSGNAIEVRGSINVANNNWHHIVVTYSGSSAASGVKIYTDGILNTNSTVTDALSSATTSTASFQVGAFNNGSQPFTGQIDDPRIYNYPLTVTQIKTLYNGGGAVRYGPVTGSP